MTESGASSDEIEGNNPKPAQTIGLKRISSSDTLKSKMVDSGDRDSPARLSNSQQTPTPKKAGTLDRLNWRTDVYCSSDWVND